MLSTSSKPTKSSRPKGRHRLALWTESLELRRLLAATPAVASVMTFAIGLPIASLEAGAYTPVPAESTWQMSDQTTQQIISSELAPTSGGSNGNIGLATPAGTIQTGISLPLFESSYGGPPAGMSPFGPPTTGPATSLNPQGSGVETAIALASQVASPTPGRSDRISSIVRTPPIIPLPHYEEPEAPVTQAPEIQEKAPAKPVQPPADKAQPPEKAAEPAIKPPAIEVIPAPTPDPKPAEPKEVSFEAWDAAIDLVETDLPELTPAVPSSHAEGSMAVGILLAAWGGWNYRASVEGRSKRRPASIESLEAARNGAG